MAIFEFKLPDIGEGVMEGEIVKWLVKAGEVIGEDQPMVEVMTDKATVTIPSPRGGKVVRTHGAEGEVAKVHEPLVTLEVGEAEAATANGAPAASEAAPDPVAQRVAPSDEAAEGKVLATPVTRRMAREHGLDLNAIPGSGPQGRITKADVQAAISGSGAVAVGQQTSANQLRAPTAPLSSGAGDQRIPLRGMRRRIAEKMVRSMFTAPHFTFVEELDATGLVSLRKRLNDQLEAAGEQTRLSFLPFIVKATIAALRRFPQLNSNFDDAAQELVVRGTCNIGIAAATGEGLTVPVLKSAERMTLRQTSEEIARLAQAARERRLKVEELTSGTFTITSLGQKGGLFATPIINYPEVAILGVHRMRKRPVVVDDEVVIREMMHLSLSFDHRVIDGSVGADFTYEVIRYLEHPELLILELA